MTEPKNLEFAKVFGLRDFNRLASGAYGTVYTCKSKSRTLALKFFSNDKYSNAKSAEDYCKIEHRIMDHLCQNESQESRHSPFIYQTMIDRRFGGATVMEYIEGWTVAKYSNGTALSNSKLFRNSMRALRWLHEKNVVHGDLSPSNVIITKSGKIMLIDFGFSMTEQDLLERPEDWRAGSTRYISPETADLAISQSQSIIRKNDPELKNLLQKADVWSMCAVFAHTETKNLPWHKIAHCEDDMKRVFQSDRFMHLLEESLGDAWGYLRHGFEFDWKCRPDASRYIEILDSLAPSLKRRDSK